MNDSESDQDMKRIEASAHSLGEHFDTVQIFCTRHESESEESGGTINCNYGLGNWFARYGHVRDWLIRQDERSKMVSRGEQD